jgi:hypothetical protein
MQMSYLKSLPVEFDANSRVWIYQSNRSFSPQESMQIEEKLKEFISSWNSHGVQVKGYSHVYFGQFIVLMADERASQVSGCSTDSSVHLMKELEHQLSIQLFDRQLLAFYVKDQVLLMPLMQLASGLTQGLIDAETLYFNNTVATKKELENDWIIPLKNSWLADRISVPRPVTQ